MTASVHLYPFCFEVPLEARVWGGRKLETRLGKKLSTDQPVGEAWEIFWKNRVTNGVHAGKTLGELIAAYPKAIAGADDASPEFPLLVKFIDAQDWLSVQVHPDDALALKLEGQPRGKTECWYIIDAAQGAQLAYGLSEPMDAERFREAIRTGRAGQVLQYVTVAPGDFIYVPAGTQHAIGPGILLYELQQTSDTTYRVYDWDRMGLDGKPRELHLDKALISTRFTVKPTAKVPYEMRHGGPGYDVASLIRGPYFGLDKIVLKGACVLDTGGKRAHLLSVVAGQAELHCEDCQPVVLSLGMSVFVPAEFGLFTLVTDHGAEILHAWPE